MDVLKLRYLIREAIEDTIKQQSSFKIGDKVTTVDGDTATITMVEHPFYTVELESTGTTKSFQFKDLAPFVEKEVKPQNEGFLLKENVNVSPGLEFHYKNKLNLLECVYRIGSEAYINFYAEAKKLLKEGKIEVNALDKEVLKTDIGEYGIFEGEKVPLDLPMLNEVVVDYDFSKEELIKVIKQLKRGASTEIGMIKAFEKALGRELTDDEIRGFKIDPSKVGRASLDEEKKLTYNDFVRMVSADMMAGAAPDEYPSDERVRKDAKYLYNRYLQGASVWDLFEAEKKKDPPLGKPKRGGSKAYYVYVRDPKTKRIKKVSFGSGGLRAKINNPKARQAFAARHRCSEKNDRTKPSYWSCRLPRYAKALGLGANKNTYW